MAAIDLSRPIFKSREPPPPPITAEDLDALRRDLEAMAQAPSVPQVAPPIAPPAYTVPEQAYPSIDVGPSPSPAAFTPGRYPGTTGEPLPWPSTIPAPPIPEETSGLTPFQQYAERLRASARPKIEDYYATERAKLAERLQPPAPPSVGIERALGMGREAVGGGLSAVGGAAGAGLGAIGGAVGAGAGLAGGAAGRVVEPFGALKPLAERAVSPFPAAAETIGTGLGAAAGRATAPVRALTPLAERAGAPARAGAEYERQMRKKSLSTLEQAIEWLRVNLEEPAAGVAEMAGLPSTMPMGPPDLRYVPRLGYGAGAVPVHGPAEVAKEAQNTILSRVKARDPKNPKDYLIDVWEEAGNYHRERPGFVGQKGLGQALFSPLNLIGLGWEPHVARAFTTGAKALVTTTARAAVRGGEAVGHASVRGIQEALGPSSLVPGAVTVQAGRKGIPKTWASIPEETQGALTRYFQAQGLPDTADVAKVWEGLDPENKAKSWGASIRYTKAPAPEAPAGAVTETARLPSMNTPREYMEELRAALRKGQLTAEGKSRLRQVELELGEPVSVPAGAAAKPTEVTPYIDRLKGTVLTKEEAAAEQARGVELAALMSAARKLDEGGQVISQAFQNLIDDAVRQSDQLAKELWEGKRLDKFERNVWAEFLSDLEQQGKIPPGTASKGFIPAGTRRQGAAARGAEPPVTAAGEVPPTGGGARIPLEPGLVPESEAVGLERGFTERLRTTEGLVSPDAKRVLDENIQTYEQLGNQVAHNEAAARIATDPVASRARVLDMSRPSSAIDMAEGLQLMQRASAAGDLDEYLTLAAAIAAKGTGIGQAEQMLSTISRMSQDGIMMTLARVLRKGRVAGKGPAIEARIAKADAAEIEAIGEAELKRVKAEYDEQLARAQRRIAQLERKPMLRNSLFQEIDLLFRGESGALRASLDKVSFEDAERIRERAAEILRMEPGAGREAARQALMDDILGLPSTSAKATPKLRPVKEKPVVDQAARAEARQLAKDIENMTEPFTVGLSKERPADRIAMSRIVGILRKTDTQLSLEDAAEIRTLTQNLTGLTGEARTKGINALVDAVKQRDPVAVRLRQIAEEAATKRNERKELNDLMILTQEIMREAKTQPLLSKNRMIGNLKRITSPNGLGIPPVLAQSLMDRARFIEVMEPGLQQNRKYAEWMNDVKNLLPPKWWESALDLYGMPIGAKTMWDYGFMMRQGALLGVKHPGRWKEAGEFALKASRDPAFAERLQDQIATLHTANLADEVGLKFDEIWEGNEFFGSKTMRKVPGYQGSQRSFVVPGNVLRHYGFHDVVNGWLPKGFDSSTLSGKGIVEWTAATGKLEQDFRDLALIYNAASGKSNIPWLKQNKGFLRLPFFAPQWALSAPEFVGRSIFTPQGRKLGGEMLAKYVGGVLAIEMIGQQAGVWDAEFDPRSSQFGQVRLKGTQQYYDPTLGLGGWIKLVAQMAPTPGPTGWQPYHKQADGDLVPTPWIEALGKFGRGKLHPIPGELWNWAEGQNIVGEKRVRRENIGLNAETALSVLNTAKSLFSSLTPQDIVEGFLDDGIRGGVLALPNIAGMPGRMYETFGDKQQKATDTLFPGKLYKNLDVADQRKVNDSTEIKLAISEMKPRDLDIRDIVQDRYDRYNTVGTEIEVGKEATATRPAEPGLRDFIEAGMTGEKLREEIQAAKAAKYRAARDLLTDDIIAYSTQNKKYKLHDVYAQMWLNVPLKKDLVTGELNFKERDAERAAILLEAQDALKAAGRDSTYITGRGEDTFRKQAWEDPVVAKVMKQYDADIETLRPYQAAADVVKAQSPLWTIAQQRHDALANNKEVQKEFDRTDYDWRMYQRELEGDSGHYGYKERLRANSSNGIQKAGEKWEYFGPLRKLGPQLPKLPAQPLLPQLPAFPSTPPGGLGGGLRGGLTGGIQ